MVVLPYFAGLAFSIFCSVYVVKAMLRQTRRMNRYLTMALVKKLLVNIWVLDSAQYCDHQSWISGWFWALPKELDNPCFNTKKFGTLSNLSMRVYLSKHKMKIFYYRTEFIQRRSTWQRLRRRRWRWSTGQLPILETWDFRRHPTPTWRRTRRRWPSPSPPSLCRRLALVHLSLTAVSSVQPR